MVGFGRGNAQLEAEFGNRKAVQAATRPLSDDSLYVDLLKSQAPVNQSAIGVLVEPSITMDAACFSFGAKPSSSA